MQKTLIGAIYHYFGKLPGQTTGDFQKEITALSPSEKAWFAANLATVGYVIIEPKA